MRDKNKLYSVLVFAYCIYFILTVVLDLTGWEWTSIPLRYTSYGMYLLLASGAIYGFHKGENRTVTYIALPVLLILFLFSAGSIIRGVPLLFICLAILKTNINMLSKGLFFLFYLLILLLSLFLCYLGDFGAKTVLSTLPSPNGYYNLVVIDDDQGALGGNTIIDLEREYFGLAKHRIRTVYIGHWGEKPFVQWRDDENALINTRTLNVFSDPVWNARR